MRLADQDGNIHEGQLSATRAAWAETLGEIQHDLANARRSVAALESLVQAYDAALTATEKLPPSFPNVAAAKR